MRRSSSSLPTILSKMAFNLEVPGGKPVEDGDIKILIAWAIA